MIMDSSSVLLSLQHNTNMPGFSLRLAYADAGNSYDTEKETLYRKRGQGSGRLGHIVCLQVYEDISAILGEMSNRPDSLPWS